MTPILALTLSALTLSWLGLLAWRDRRAERPSKATLRRADEIASRT